MSTGGVEDGGDKSCLDDEGAGAALGCSDDGNCDDMKVALVASVAAVTALLPAH